jgi:hypothetical protein
MEVTATNGVKVYNVSAGKAVPQWLQDRKKKDKNYIKGLGSFQASFWLTNAPLASTPSIMR